jgi:hypothetical protein
MVYATKQISAMASSKQAWTLTSCKNALAAASRETGRQILLVWCFIIGESDLYWISVSREEIVCLNSYITIDSVNDILGREWRNLGINVD